MTTTTTTVSTAHTTENFITHIASLSTFDELCRDECIADDPGSTPEDIAEYINAARSGTVYLISCEETLERLITIARNLRP